MNLTRAQAKRAVEWEAWRSLPRSGRPKLAPSCLTCGARPTHEFRPGEPAYGCRHPAVRVDDEVMVRARETFAAERKAV